MRDRIDARALRGAVLRSVEGITRTALVLPWFSVHLEVRFLLLVVRGRGCVVTRDLPQMVEGRSLVYAFPPRIDPAFGDLRTAQFEELFHFDPWWILKDRVDLPEVHRKVAAATNVAGMELEGARPLTLFFDDALSSVMAARLAGKPRSAPLLGREAISRNLRASGKKGSE